jgi:hypothetical protein
MLTEKQPEESAKFDNQIQNAVPATHPAPTPVNYGKPVPPVVQGADTSSAGAAVPPAPPVEKSQSNSAPPNPPAPPAAGNPTNPASPGQLVPVEVAEPTPTAEIATIPR